MARATIAGNRRMGRVADGIGKFPPAVCAVLPDWKKLAAMDRADRRDRSGQQRRRYRNRIFARNVIGSWTPSGKKLAAETKVEGHPASPAGRPADNDSTKAMPATEIRQHAGQRRRAHRRSEVPKTRPATKCDTGSIPGIDDHGREGRGPPMTKRDDHTQNRGPEQDRHKGSIQSGSGQRKHICARK